MLFRSLRKEKKRAMLGDIGSGWGVGDSGRAVGGRSEERRVGKECE